MEPHLSATISSFDPFERSGAEILAQVLALSKQNKKTLGFLPDSAFSERASKRTLLVATENDLVAGYVLFDLPKSAIKLVHLCVRADHRKSGLAKLLLDEVIRASPNRTGVIANCRRDYGIDHVWKALGFVPKSEKSGRSLDGSILTTWWRPLGGPDLFEQLILDTAMPIAVLDSTIVIDIHASANVIRPDRDASLALMGPWLESRVTFAVSSELDSELNQLSDQKERQRQRNASQSLTRVPTTRPDDARLEGELAVRIGDKEMSKDVSLAHDLNHLADAIRAGARYFVTNDQNLIDVTSAWTLADFHISVVRPHQLVIAVDDVIQSATYEPRLLKQTEFRWKRAADFDFDLLESAFLGSSNGERAVSFRRTCAQRWQTQRSGTPKFLSTARITSSA